MNFALLLRQTLCRFAAKPEPSISYMYVAVPPRVHSIAISKDAGSAAPGSPQLLSCPLLGRAAAARDTCREDRHPRHLEHVDPEHT
jgi:hypothetical protein